MEKELNGQQISLKETENVEQPQGENGDAQSEWIDTRCCNDVCCGAFSLLKNLSARKKKSN